MSGIINVLKPPGMTSHDVVAYMRRISGIKKCGHTGTLDPGAAGVLPVCLGKATRVSEYLMAARKGYRAELMLGQATETEDASGKVVAEAPVPVLSPGRLANLFSDLEGPMEQVPPMYSAIKKNGRKLYEIARQGETIEREPRNIYIYKLSLVNIEEKKVLFDVECSKGTYVRTLCSDIARMLGTYGHLSFLLRTSVGPFNLENAYTLEELSVLAVDNRLQEAYRTIDTALLHLPALILNEDEVKKIINGVAVLGKEGVDSGDRVRLYTPEGSFLAVAVAVGENRLNPEKVFIEKG